MSESGPLILIVEDEASVRRSLRAILVDSGYRAVEAETAAEGIQRSQEHNPDRSRRWCSPTSTAS